MVVAEIWDIWVAFLPRTLIACPVADPAPVLRWEAALPRGVRAYASVTPLTPPPAPVPTPLDVQRQHRTAANRPYSRRQSVNRLAEKSFATSDS